MTEDLLLQFAINNGAGVLGMVLMYFIANKKINSIKVCPYVQKKLDGND